MIRGSKPLSLFAVLLLACWWGVIGCGQRQPTTASDILDYVRNADAGAEVRRLDPDAQTYVDAIFKAYGKWQKAWAPIDDIATVDALWDKESNEWRDDGEVSKKLAAAFPQTTGDLSQAKASIGDSTGSKASDTPPSRVEAYDELLKAIENVPPTFQDQRTELIREIRARLASRFGGLESAVARYRRVGEAYHQLLSLAAAHGEAFDPEKMGLAFTDGETTGQAVTLWSRLHTLFVQERKAELAQIESLLTKGKQTRQRDIEEKQRLPRRGASNRARRRELELTIRYYDARIKSAQKRKEELHKEQEAKRVGVTSESPSRKETH